VCASSFTTMLSQSDSGATEAVLTPITPMALEYIIACDAKSGKIETRNAAPQDAERRHQFYAAYLEGRNQGIHEAMHFANRARSSFEVGEGKSLPVIDNIKSAYKRLDEGERKILSTFSQGLGDFEKREAAVALLQHTELCGNEKKELIQCYRQNSSDPLKCQEVVSAFNKCSTTVAK
jgi:hypothetical protein